jgi:hypothetical protein
VVSGVARYILPVYGDTPLHCKLPVPASTSQAVHQPLLHLNYAAFLQVKVNLILDFVPP